MKTTFEDKQEGFEQPILWLNPHLWRKILLNDAPNAFCEAVQDKRRRTYWLEATQSEAKVTLRLCRRGAQVARSVLTWARPNEAVLEDILVASSYQQQGLATHLLNRAIASAQRYGSRYLTGRVIRKDAERNPDLLNWYRRRGFEVQAVQAAPPVETVYPLSVVARRSQSQYETVATLRLHLEHPSTVS